MLQSLSISNAIHCVPKRPNSTQCSVPIDTGFIASQSWFVMVVDLARVPVSDFRVPTTIERAGTGTWKSSCRAGLGIFYCSAPAEHSPVPAARSERRRAQRRSRPARFRAAEGLVLTAASTMASWRNTGTADQGQLELPSVSMRTIS